MGTETLGLRHLLGMSELRTGRLAAMQPKKRSMTVQISAWEDSPVREALLGAVQQGVKDDLQVTSKAFCSVMICLLTLPMTDTAPIEKRNMSLILFDFDIFILQKTMTGTERSAKSRMTWVTFKARLYVLIVIHLTG